MLQFTKETDYGLRFLTKLIKMPKGHLLSLRIFSKSAGISFLFLQRIVKKLKAAGIIDATKGASGGYFLKKNHKHLNVKDVVEALEGKCNLSHCYKAGKVCNHAKKCDAKKIFCKIDAQFMDCLKNIKFI